MGISAQWSSFLPFSPVCYICKLIKGEKAVSPVGGVTTFSERRFLFRIDVSLLSGGLPVMVYRLACDEPRQQKYCYKQDSYSHSKSIVRRASSFHRAALPFFMSFPVCVNIWW